VKKTAIYIFESFFLVFCICFLITWLFECTNVSGKHEFFLVRGIQFKANAITADEYLPDNKKVVNQSHYRHEVPIGFKEVKVPRLRDNGPGLW